jgi:hypothetical protein
MNVLKQQNGYLSSTRLLNAIAAVGDGCKSIESFPEERLMYLGSAHILAKGDQLTLDYFKTPRPPLLMRIILRSSSLHSHFIFEIPSAVQDEGLALINSDFFLTGTYPDYRLYYLITGCLINTRRTGRTFQRQT